MRALAVAACVFGALGCAKNPSLAEVRKAQIPAWKSAFAKQGMAYPPGRLLIRVFKEERQLELWAQGSASEPFRLLKTYAVTAASGGPGPKRKEGDRQVPEGFYEIVGLNPKSRYHLSMRVNYPNASDRLLADPKRPGGDIFIHGKAVSIGCVAIGDRAIEELYALVEDVHGKRGTWPLVHLFPCRMEGPAWRRLTADRRPDDPLCRFWLNLKQGYDLFERDRRVPEVRVGEDGAYRFSERRNAPAASARH